MLVKWSKCHSSEPFFAPEEGGKFKMMNGTDKMSIFFTNNSQFRAVREMVKRFWLCKKALINNSKKGSEEWHFDHFTNIF